MRFIKSSTNEMTRDFIIIKIKTKPYADVFFSSEEALGEKMRMLEIRKINFSCDRTVSKW